MCHLFLQGGCYQSIHCVSSLTFFSSEPSSDCWNLPTICVLTLNKFLEFCKEEENGDVEIQSFVIFLCGPIVSYCLSSWPKAWGSFLK